MWQKHACRHADSAIDGALAALPGGQPPDLIEELVRHEVERLEALLGAGQPPGSSSPEAAEGGWGIAGTAFGREEFAKLLG